jgi:hypothetical protein
MTFSSAILSDLATFGNGSKRIAATEQRQISNDFRFWIIFGSIRIHHMRVSLTVVNVAELPPFYPQIYQQHPNWFEKIELEKIPETLQGWLIS